MCRDYHAVGGTYSPVFIVSNVSAQVCLDYHGVGGTLCIFSLLGTNGVLKRVFCVPWKSQNIYALFMVYADVL